MPKVSVVIPIFGVENYIERCARSLFEQTLEDMEFIFVDDCTKDKSISILKDIISEYPNRKIQTKIIHHEYNKGLPTARRSGFEIAEGEYIANCDSDDWVDKEMYNLMYQKAIETNAEIVVCNYYEGNGIENKLRSGFVRNSISSFKEDLFMGKVTWSLWNKLIKKELFQNPITWPTKNMGEDMALCLQLIHYCKKIEYIDNPLYYFFANDSSISRSRTEEKVYDSFIQAILNTQIVTSFYEKVGGIPLYCLRNLKLSTKNKLCYIIDDKKYYKIWRDTFPEIEQEVLWDCHFPWRIRMKCLMIILGIYPWKSYR